MPTILVLKVLRFFGGGWKPVVVFGWKPSLDDDTKSIDFGLSGVSDCMRVCFFGCNPVGMAGTDTKSIDSGVSGVSDCMTVCFVGCNPVGVAGADEFSEPNTCLNSSMVTNANYGWTQLRCEIRLQW